MKTVSARAVLREGVFVAESDDVFRAEGANGDAHVVRVGRNGEFLQISTCGPTAPNPANPAFLQRGDAWSPLRNPFVPTLILGLMHGLRADAWPASHSGSRRCDFMRGDHPASSLSAAAFVVRRGVCRLVLRDLGDSGRLMW